MSVTRALVIDDDQQDRAYLRMHLEDSGIEVLAPARKYATVDELIDFAVSARVDVTICDHRLQTRGLAPFFGAEAVASLVRRSQVAVLVTSYYDVDFDTSIRLHRRNIPALLRREELQEPGALSAVTDIVRREIDGIVAPERQLWPTVVRVGDLTGMGPDLVLDVFVPGWRSEQAVRMPAAALPDDLAALGRQLRGKFLLVEVNTGAQEKDQLFFGRVDGLAEPAEWPEMVTGIGAELPRRSEPVRGVFEDPAR